MSDEYFSQFRVIAASGFILRGTYAPYLREPQRISKPKTSKRTKREHAGDFRKTAAFAERCRQGAKLMWERRKKCPP